MRFSSKKSCALGVPGFTLREILVVAVVVSIGLLSIISLLTYGVSFIQKSRQTVIAVNLAREWIEAVYQMRDTNRQRRAGRKEECRLKTNPLVDELGVGCQNDTWMQSWFYVLDTQELLWQKYFLLTGYSTTWIVIADGVQSSDARYSLCFSGDLWDACPGSSALTPEGSYFREIQGYGLRDKDAQTTWGEYLDCVNGETTCGSYTAKEFRFCSSVSYIWYGTWTVKLCGVITNFKEK